MVYENPQEAGALPTIAAIVLFIVAILVWASALS